MKKKSGMKASLKKDAKNPRAMKQGGMPLKTEKMPKSAAYKKRG